MAVHGLFRLRIISTITLTMVFGLIAGLLGVILWLSGAEGINGIILALGFSVGLMFLQWYFSPSILKALMRLQELKKEDYPDIYKSVKELAEKSGIPMPKLYLAKNPVPNAFTFGRSKKDSYLVLHTGLIEALNKKETESVIAHELGHIKHSDYIIMTIASILPVLLYYIAIMFTPRNRERSNIGLVYIGAMAARSIGQLLVLWLSRRREYYADAHSADITDKNSMISALEKISYGITEKENYVQKPNTSLSTFYIESPNADEEPQFITKIKNMEMDKAKEFEHKYGFLELLMTHPMTFKRVIALRKLQ